MPLYPITPAHIMTQKGNTTGLHKFCKHNECIYSECDLHTRTRTYRMPGQNNARSLPEIKST